MQKYVLLYSQLLSLNHYICCIMLLAITQKIGRLENDHYDKLLFYMVLITSLESLSQLFGTQVNLPEEIIQQLPLPELSYGENYLPWISIT